MSNFQKAHAAFPAKGAAGAAPHGTDERCSRCRGDPSDCVSSVEGTKTDPWVERDRGQPGLRVLEPDQHSVLEAIMELTRVGGKSWFVFLKGAPVTVGLRGEPSVPPLRTAQRPPQTPGTKLSLPLSGLNRSH